MANLSVVVLTLLPIELHWLWPAMLIALAIGIALEQRRKQMRIRAAMAPKSCSPNSQAIHAC